MTPASKAFALCLASVLAIVSASAQQQPNLEKGFHADKVYSSADIDHVNLFNGSLNIVVPLGQRYRVSSALDYGLSLVYAANNWDTEYGTTTVFEQCPGQPAGDMCYDQKQQNYAVPYRRSSAGLGWTLSLGRLYLPDASPNRCDLCAVYQSPDGGEHSFSIKLHGTDPGTPNTSYTNDNTYRRLRNDGAQYYVDFPNGNTYTFDETTGALKTMSDAFGNSVGISPTVVPSPSASCGTSDVKQWDIHDSTGRHQYVYFRQDLQPYTADGIACRADLAAFNGARAVYSLNYTVKTISRKSVYTEVDNPAEIGNAVSVPLLTRIDLPGSAGSYTAVYDIGSKQTGTTVQGLTSDDSEVPDVLSDVRDGLNPGSFTGEIVSLRMPTRATLRWTRQQYSLAVKPPPDPLFPSPTGSIVYTNRVSGVKTRSLEVDGATAVWNYSSLAVSPTISVTTVTEPVTQTRTSTYFSICEDCNSPPSVPAEYGLPVYRSATAPRVASGSQGPYTLPAAPALGIRMNNVTTIFNLTAGSQTVNQIVNALNLNNSFNTTFYAENVNNTLTIRTSAVGSSVSFQIDGSIANSAHTALGLDTNVHNGTTDNVEDGHYLSSVVTDSAGNDLKRTYVSYETDPVPAFCPCGFGTYDLNRRISGETVLTMNPDHPGTPDRAITNYSDFDGLGHYRTTTIDGNLPGENARATTTKYNQPDSDVDAGAYNSTGGSGLVLPSNGKWVLDTYSSVTATNATNVFSKVNSWFDSNTGFLQRQRILAAGTSQNSNDTIVRFTQTGGNVTREEYFGGDPTPSTMLESGETPAAGLGTSPLSTISLGTPRYQTDHTYDRGSLKSSKYFDLAAGMAMPFYSVFRIIDPSTGLPSSEFDPAGSSTGFNYDLLGRLTATTPPAGLTATAITYNDATSNANASVDVTTAPTASHVDYDALGRVRLEWTKERNGNWSVVSTEYDAAGRKNRVSTPEEAMVIGTPPSFSHFTAYTYDALGRVTRVTAPDNQYVDTSYQGAQSIKRTVKVQTSATGTSDAVTTETYDRQGRLYKVDEPIGTSTTYGYDVGNHISQVSMTSGSTTQPARTFTYDNRGFLVQETHPESGTTVWSYDPRGHPLTKFVATGSRYNMRYGYDAAERLTLVRSRGDWLVNPPWFVPAKEFTYSIANSGSNLSLGKLDSAIRHNWTAAGSDVTVKETYTYAGNGGSLTGKITEINRVPAPGATAVLLQKFSQGYDRDALGLLKTITYPTCADVTRPCGDSTWDAISQDFTIGRLTAITGKRGSTLSPFVNDVTYSVNGMPNQITHSNSMADVQTPDPSGMPRPYSIEFHGYSACTAPAISVPPQNVTITSGQSASLGVTASGTASLTYEWFDVSSPTAVWTSSQSGYTTPALTQDHQYYVVVYNACGRASTQSTPAQVTVSSCGAPAITSGPSFTPPGYNQSTTISIAASGTGLHYAWYQGDAPSTSTPVGADSSTFITPALTATRHYWVRVSNTCGSVNSTTAIVTVPLPTPTGLIATWNGSTTVTILWTGSAGADHYIVERRSGGGFVPIGSVSGAALSDTSLAADTTYIYRVRAADATSESFSSYSNNDLATTTVMNSLTTVAFTDIDQIRMLINRIRGATGLAALSWTDVMNGYSTPLPQVGQFVYANHILALRARMDAALGAAGVPAQAYAANVSVGAPITALAWTELRGRAQ